jgi:hypothetical protein
MICSFKQIDVYAPSSALYLEYQSNCSHNVVNAACTLVCNLILIFITHARASYNNHLLLSLLLLLCS